MFDLDGTLLNTEKAIVSSFEQVLGKYKPDLVLSEEDKVSFLGPTLQESFQKYAPEFDTDQLVKEYRECNREAHFTGIIQPFPHVKELLDWLKENGYPIAIASSKKKETVELGLEVTGLRDYFEVIVGVEDVEKPKPDKESLVKTYSRLGYGPDNAIYIGDSTGDIICAKNAGVYSIAFVSNMLKDKELKDARPNKVIYDMAEIKDILQEKHPWTSDLS